MDKNNRKNVAKHILPTSGNLLGLCFAIFSFIKISGLAGKTIIDEFLVVAIVLFLLSGGFSYFSMRSLTKEEYYERIAEFIFLIGMLILAICAIGIGMVAIH